MKKLLLILNLLLFFSCVKKAKNIQNDNEIKIGIMQIVAHPALDRAREGFKQAFKEKNIEVVFDEKNANGEITSANLIASSFTKNNFDLIYSISTPATIAAANSTNTIPIVFSAVTDANDAAINRDNVTGVTDYVDVYEQIKILKDIKADAKSIGFLYNSSEKNSTIQLELLKEAAKKLNLEVIEKSITQSNEVTTALSFLTNRVDAIYTPTDNLIASVMPLIASMSIEKNIIVIGSEVAHVEAGALLTKGIDYYNMGKAAGNMAIDILINKKDIKNIDIQNMPLEDLVINQETKTKLNLQIMEGKK